MLVVDRVVSQVAAKTDFYEGKIDFKDFLQNKCVCEAKKEILASQKEKKRIHMHLLLSHLTSHFFFSPFSL